MGHQLHWDGLVDASFMRDHFLCFFYCFRQMPSWQPCIAVTPLSVGLQVSNREKYSVPAAVSPSCCRLRKLTHLVRSIVRRWIRKDERFQLSTPSSWTIFGWLIARILLPLGKRVAASRPQPEIRVAFVWVALTAHARRNTFEFTARTRRCGGNRMASCRWQKGASLKFQTAGGMATPRFSRSPRTIAPASARFCS